MEITRETDYAIRCVLYLSKKNGAVVMVEEISKEMSIPKSFLSKILQKLAKKDLVKSFRGVRGGFQLALHPSRISLLEVIEAIQGHLFINRCAAEENICTRSGYCTVHPLWNEVGECLENKLREYDFERLSGDNGIIENGCKVFFTGKQDILCPE
ncbi:MAG: Rrf2 family transcriptional regulator [Nitrospirae bacterium]|nr:MAG: Rrf2 family transcriptional regulator [Nitrospirota bacterium]